MGIRMEGGEVNISDNMEISGKDGAVLIGGSSTSVEMHNNIIFGAVRIYISNATDIEISYENDIFDNEYGISVQGGNASIRYNSIHHNQWGIYLNTSHGPEVSNNNTIENNSIGIWISSDVSIYERQIWWNDIVNNTIGIEVEDDPGIGNYFHCECNWWGGTNDTPPYNKGPYDPSPGDPDINTFGTGQYVKDYFWYRDPDTNNPYWLQLPGLQATNCTGPPPP